MHERFKEDVFTTAPEDWQIKKLKEVSKIIPSNVDKKTNPNEKKILLCNYMDVYYKDYIDDKIDFMESTASELEIEKFSLVKGDVLITKDSETWDDIAVSAVVAQKLNNVLCGYHLALIRPDIDIIEGDFLAKLLKAKFINKQFQRQSQGLTRFGLTVSAIEDSLITFPHIPEQRQIAKILSTVDDAIEKTDVIIKETQKLKKGLMQKLFTEGIGHTRFRETKIGRIPDEWEVITLQNMIDDRIILGHLDGNHGSLYPRSNEFVHEGVPYLIANCIVNGKIDFNKGKFLSKERAEKLQKGFANNFDVLFAHNATVGPVGILETNLDYVILSTSLTYYRCDQNNLNPYYLYHYMSSSLFTKQYERVMKQTTRNQVPITAQRKFFHIIPARDEQDKIADILTNCDLKIENEIQNKDELTKLKKGLMQILITGKVRVKV